MSKDVTQDMPDGRSFEERVFARFDALDARFDNLEGRLANVEGRLVNVENRLGNVEGRLEALEEQSERRALETKPVWEQALAEILAVKEGLIEVREGLANVERKLDVLSLDIVQVRSDQRRLEKRIERLETRPAT